ncbi:hypothetical protein EG68_04720 [Paragonimus skrjabini miyazakii]|uniref:C2 domain-containing protein n=1 Tax=Paragonimus skrjabini miyazakii TaxID=59628 RepID=A0A8S9YYC6_9TREM|nr:hypothetical protein EG68_04720 [Paragonimus skrjabini miyazakii]
MSLQVKHRSKELALTKLITQYDDLELWIHNYLPPGSITESEREHIKRVMLKDQALKKMDGDRINGIIGSFPVKLRPELLTPVVQEMVEQNPAVPGSGLVSLCGPVVLDKSGCTPSADPKGVGIQNNTSEPFSSASILRRLSREFTIPGLSPKPKNTMDPTTNERCPFCYAKFGLFQKKLPCDQCGRFVCRRCIFQFNNDSHLCKDCVDLARAICKTGDWFAQYLSSKPGNPLRLEIDLQPSSTNSLMTRSPMKGSRKEDSNLSVPKPSMSNRVNVAAAKRSTLNFPGEVPRLSRTDPEVSGKPAFLPVHMSLDAGQRTPAYRISTNENIQSEQPYRYQRQPRTNKESPLCQSLDIPNDVIDKPEEDVNNEKTQSDKKSHHKRKKSIMHLSQKHRKSLDVTNDTSESAYRTTVDIQGDLEVSLDYDGKHSRLAVMIWGARNIAAVDRKTGLSNPYAKVYLHPDPTKQTHRKVTCKGHTCSPNFTQGVCYTITPAELVERALVVELWHKRPMGSDIFLGEITIPLYDYKWDDKAKKRINLSDKRRISVTSNEAIYRGELNVSLRFALSDKHKKLAQVTSGLTNFPGTLEVMIIEAKNLVCHSVGTNVNAFVKASLVSESGELVSRSTEVMHRTSNPKWNGIVHFDEMTQKDLMLLALELTVWHRAGSSRMPEFLGGVRLSTESSDSSTGNNNWKTCTRSELVLWMEVIKRPDQWSQAFLPIHEFLY